MRFGIAIAVFLSSVVGAGGGISPLGHASNPLAPFERLMGGEWVLEGTTQTFEWGLGKRTVHSRAYFLMGSEKKLVSEALWFWHPGENAIRGYAVATDMPVVFFDYRTRFEGDEMINELVSYDESGEPSRFEERWKFTSDDHYQWSLYAETEEGRKKTMGGTFSRRSIR